MASGPQRAGQREDVGQAAAACGHTEGASLVALTRSTRMEKSQQALELKGDPMRCSAHRNPCLQAQEPGSAREKKTLLLSNCKQKKRIDSGFALGSKKTKLNYCTVYLGNSEDWVG